MANRSPQSLGHATKLLERARHREAERQYTAILGKNPRHFEALHRLGFLRYEQARYAEALKLLGDALKLNPNAADALSHYGMALRKLGRLEEALAYYDKSLAAKPDYADAINNRGNVLLDLGRYREALADFDAALAVRPRYPEALNNRGNVLMELKRFEDALESYERAIEIRPDYLNALTNQANALLKLRRYDKAVENYRRVIEMNPENTADLLFNTGRALQELGKSVNAEAAFDEALKIDARHTGALYHRGHARRALNRIQDAAADFRRLLAIQPDHPNALTSLLGCHMQSCHWDGVARLSRDLRGRVGDPRFIIEPFQLISLPTTPAEQRRCAEMYVRVATSNIDMVPRRHARTSDKIRLGYFSADFRTHVVATVITELFELHDRTRFELIGISFGKDDKGELRRRIVDAVDQFYDVRSFGDREIATLMNELGIDIAIDLTGHTADSRTEALVFRPCPIQVNYLGYPGTTGATFIDYIMGDPIVLPFEDQAFFTEKIVQLPDCYLPNDSHYLKLPAELPTRAEVGLPERGFVFCGFTQSYKITAEMFEVWVRLLASTEGSVLWLAPTNDTALENLRREAARRGVDPKRMIVAPRADPMEKHLVRHRQANLFLDTTPYNGHTTAANALGAGLPVLTCKGNSFASRVAASLLHAVGLPELVTNSLEEYEALALKLAAEPDLLESHRSRLEENRRTYPLFDQKRMCRHIEAAYTTMWEIHRRGEPPRSFRVPAQFDA